MEQSKKGIALILFAILLSMGGAITGGILSFLWMIGMPIGLVGLIMVLMDKGGKNS